MESHALRDDEEWSAAAQFRSAGRPIHRDLTLPKGATLGRAYDYDDANGDVGRLSGMHVTINGTEVAGSSLLFEGLQRKREQLLGVSGGSRFTSWSYDDRGRVSGSVVATTDPTAVPLLGIPGASIVQLTDADFRTDLDHTVARSTDAPSTLTAESLNKGHKIASITHGPNTESISIRAAGERKSPSAATMPATTTTSTKRSISVPSPNA